MAAVRGGSARRQRETRSVWYVSLLLNSLAIALSHVVAVAVFTELRDNRHAAVPAGAISTGIVAVASIVVYVFIYGASGYVPMGRISDGLRLRMVAART